MDDNIKILCTRVWLDQNYTEVQWKAKLSLLELFHLPTLMHNSLFINNMYVTLLSSTCFEH